jgi:hypothetical protein
MSNCHPSLNRRKGDTRIVGPKYISGILRRFPAVLSLRFSKKKMMPSGVYPGGCSVLHSRLLPQLPKLIFSSNYSTEMKQLVQNLATISSKYFCRKDSLILVLIMVARIGILTGFTGTSPAVSVSDNIVDMIRK